MCVIACKSNGAHIPSRPYTLLEELNRFVSIISAFLDAMADFDAQQAQAQQNQFQQDQARIAFLEQNVNYITTTLQQCKIMSPHPFLDKSSTLI